MKTLYTKGRLQVIPHDRCKGEPKYQAFLGDMKKREAKRLVNGANVEKFFLLSSPLPPPFSSASVPATVDHLLFSYNKS